MVRKYAFILARGGSKRIYMKNIRSFFGKPIIGYAIEAALECDLFDRVIVSTDSQEIAEVALKFGAEVPELRPLHLSTDSVPTIEVMSYLTDRFQIRNHDLVCCIYATNPFLTSENIKLGEAMLTNKIDPKIKYVTTISEYSFPPQRSLRRASEHVFEMAETSYMMSRSQDLDKRYHECAQFWWAQAETWLFKSPMQIGLAGILLPRWLQQDIDTEEDWIEAERKFAYLKHFKCTINS
jgi:N-acylneuraminate cytidylyltransferase